MSALPGPLPSGEKLLWQGTPDWRLLAIHALHVRSLSIYFSLMLAWGFVSRLTGGAGLAQACRQMLPLVGLALVPIVLLTLYAWLTARVTSYTITSRRVVIRMGLAMNMTINLPFSRILSANARLRGNGAGDIALLPSDKSKLGYVILWPLARPWRYARPEPMLRGLPEAARVAAILARGLAASSATPVVRELPRAA